MAKSARKKAKTAITAKKSRKAGAEQSKVAEYVGCLLELHKLQGLLLSQLRKEI